MQKQHLRNIIETLEENLDTATQEGNFFFWRYMEQICDKENEELYILRDLSLLAVVLREKDAIPLTDYFGLFDYQATCKLKRLLM